MASYVLIELDTKIPFVEIFAPKYTTKDVSNVITILSDEKNLSDYQEIYVIDSENVRHDYVFQKDSNNSFLGIVRFNDLPLGMTTIYARVQDDVGNMSNIAQASFEIKESLNKVSCRVSDSIYMKVSVFDSDEEG